MSDASVLPVSGHTQEQVIRHYRNRGMPGRRGWRLAGAPGSGNEKLGFRLSNFGGCYIITFFYSVEAHMNGIHTRTMKIDT